MSARTVERLGSCSTDEHGKPYRAERNVEGVFLAQVGDDRYRLGPFPVGRGTLTNEQLQALQPLVTELLTIDDYGLRVSVHGLSSNSVTQKSSTESFSLAYQRAGSTADVFRKAGILASTQHSGHFDMQNPHDTCAASDTKALSRSVEVNVHRSGQPYPRTSFEPNRTLPELPGAHGPNPLEFVHPIAEIGTWMVPHWAEAGLHTVGAVVEPLVFAYEAGKGILAANADGNAHFVRNVYEGACRQAARELSDPAALRQSADQFAGGPSVDLTKAARDLPSVRDLDPFLGALKSVNATARRDVYEFVSAKNRFDYAEFSAAWGERRQPAASLR
jgi:hypothetical protein